jgi:hypothetical protein
VLSTSRNICPITRSGHKTTPIICLIKRSDRPVPQLPSPCRGYPALSRFFEKVAENIFNSDIRFACESVSTPEQVSGHDLALCPARASASKGCVVVPTRLEQIPFLAPQARGPDARFAWRGGDPRAAAPIQPAFGLMGRNAAERDFKKLNARSCETKEYETT